jgi:hypothetical protein
MYTNVKAFPPGGFKNSTEDFEICATYCGQSLLPESVGIQFYPHPRVPTMLNCECLFTRGVSSLIAYWPWYATSTMFLGQGAVNSSTGLGNYRCYARKIVSPTLSPVTSSPTAPSSAPKAISIYTHVGSGACLDNQGKVSLHCISVDTFTNNTLT